MASVNKVIVIGNLGRDPEMKHLPSGDAICNISVATTSSWKDKAGAKQEATEWHRISLFGKLAEIAGEYLKKGSQVYIEGRLQTRKWQDKDGSDRYATEIVANAMQMLGSRGDSTQRNRDDFDKGGHPQSRGAAKPAEKPAAKSGAGKFDDFESDIPF